MTDTQLIQTGLIQLVYASAATVEFDQDHLERLLDRARQNNTRLGVSGVLLFKDGTFFQVLEGDSQVVNQLYEMIEHDSRHNNVLVLATREIKERNFSEWSMGFTRDSQQISELPGFVGFLSDGGFVDLHGDSQRIQTILDGFRRGRWRRSANEAPKQIALATR